MATRTTLNVSLTPGLSRFVESRLVTYRPSSPVETVRVLHASRDVAKELGRKRRRR